MEENKQYFRCLMLFYFRKGKNATQTRKKKCAVYEEDVVSERVCQNWFAKFRAGDTTCEDRERSGRPLVVDNDQIKNLIKSNPHNTTREIAEIIDVSQKTVVNHLYTLGYVSRYDIWVLHNLSDKNLMDSISICDLLLKRNENCSFFKWILMKHDIMTIWQFWTLFVDCCLQTVQLGTIFLGINRLILRK